MMLELADPFPLALSNKAQRVGSRGPVQHEANPECYIKPWDPTPSALLLIQHILSTL